MRTNYTPMDWDAMSRKKYMEDFIVPVVMKELEAINMPEQWNALIFCWHDITVEISPWEERPVEEERALRKLLSAAFGLTGKWARTFDNSAGQFRYSTRREKAFVTPGFAVAHSDLNIVIDRASPQNCTITPVQETVIRYVTNCKPTEEESDE